MEPVSPPERLMKYLADGDALLLTARDRVHVKYCPDSRCGRDEPGEQCKNLDFLLDRVEAEALNRGASS